jgi:hypothetical protein
MNGKIAVSMLISFTLVVTFLIIAANIYPDLTVISSNHSFFNNEFDPNFEKIFIFGSSQVGILNSTLISNTILENYPNYDFYNLAHGGDSPEERLEILERILTLKPKIIFYGISHNDFTEKVLNNSPDKIFQFDFNYLLIFFDPENKLKLKFLNPWIVTGRIINTGLENYGIISKNSEVVIFNEKQPFYSNSKIHKIATKNELERNVALLDVPKLRVDDISSNKQFQYFKIILETLQRENIKVVVFSTPSPYEYSSQLSEKTKSNFNQILFEINTEFNIDTYNFTDKYVHLPIWYDSMHVANNPQSRIFSDDISNMILQEIES